MKSSFLTFRILVFYMICLALLFLLQDKHTLPALLCIPILTMNSPIMMIRLPLSLPFSALPVDVMLMRFVNLRSLLPAINAVVVSILIDANVNQVILLRKFLNLFRVNSVMTPIVHGAKRNQPFMNLFSTMDVFPRQSILLSGTRIFLL